MKQVARSLLIAITILVFVVFTQVPEARAVNSLEIDPNVFGSSSEVSKDVPPAEGFSAWLLLPLVIIPLLIIFRRQEEYFQEDMGKYAKTEIFGLYSKPIYHDIRKEMHEVSKEKQQRANRPFIKRLNFSSTMN